MSEYRYYQLSQTSIRLLRLLPSDKDANKLRCELFEYPLGNSDKPSYPYEALSYVWGSEDKPKSITVNNQNLHITQNLYMALLHLQDHLCSRVIWVDAICINQKDDEEKSAQVALMGQIFRSAEATRVWLGEEADDSTRALNFLTWIGGQRFSYSNRDRTSEELIEKLRMKNGPYAKDWAAVNNLFGRP